MKDKRQNQGMEDKRYFLEYERCIRQHHFSPKIYICVDEICQHKSLLCHYCINDSYHNYPQTSQSSNFIMNSDKLKVNRIVTHKDHKVIPIEEYINIFRDLYYNQKSTPIMNSTAYHSLTSSPKIKKNNYTSTSLQNLEFPLTSFSSSTENKDWKDNSYQKYLKYLKCLKNQIREISRFVEVQIEETEQMIENIFQKMRQHEKNLNEYYQFFENTVEGEEGEKEISKQIVQEFVQTTFNFLIDSQFRQKNSIQTGGYLELIEFNNYMSEQKIQIITQKDIQQKIIQQFNQIKKVAGYFQSIQNDIKKRFQSGLLTTPFFESCLNSQNKDINNMRKERIQKYENNNKLQLESFGVNQVMPSCQHSFSNLFELTSSNSFGSNTNLPENLFQVRSVNKCQRIQNIHTKSIWRVLHLYKSVCASCSSDGTIKIWDYNSQQVLRVLEQSNDAVNDIIYVPQNKILVSVCGDNTIRIFSLINYKCIRIIQGHLNAIYTCHYDHRLNILLTAGREEEVYGWNIIRGEKIFKTKSIQRPIYSLYSVSKRGEFICGDEGGSLSVFNYKDMELLRSQNIHSKTIYSIKLIEFMENQMAENTQIVTGSADGYIRITSLVTLIPLHQIKLNSFIYDLSIHMNRIFAQIGKTSNLAIIGFVQQRGNVEITTKIVGLNNGNKVRCLQIVKDSNILLYESTSNEINLDINIESF